MKKYILPLALIISFIFFAFAIYQYAKPNFSDKNSASSNSNLNGKVFNDSDAKKTGDNSVKGSGDSEASGSGEAGSPRGVGDGGGAGGGLSGNNSETPQTPNENGGSFCVLVRPGNLPDVNCFVNYIKKDAVSLKIENKLGEDMGITLDLKTCSPKIQDAIKNNEQKNFVFSCNNNDYFNQDLFVTYILQEGGNVNVGGFVSGNVSD